MSFFISQQLPFCIVEQKLFFQSVYDARSAVSNDTICRGEVFSTIKKLEPPLILVFFVCFENRHLITNLSV